MGNRGEGSLAVLSSNNKTLKCGVFDENITELIQWNIDECSVLEKDDLIMHKRVQNRINK